MIATSRFLTALECIKCKFVFGQTPSWFKGDPTSEGNKKEDSGGGEEGKGNAPNSFSTWAPPYPAEGAFNASPDPLDGLRFKRDTY